MEKLNEQPGSLAVSSVSRSRWYILTLLLVLCCIADAFADNEMVLKELAVDVTNLDSKISLGRKLLVMEDKSAELTLGEALQEPNFSRFAPSTQEEPSFGYSESAYWFIFQLDNPSNEATDHILELAYYPLQSIQLYELSTNTVSEGGSVLAVEQRSYVSLDHAFRLSVPPGSHRYLVRITSSSSISVPIYLVAHSDFIAATAKKMAIEGAFVGLLLVLALYNLFVGLSVREKTYFWYVAYIVSFGVFYAALTGFGHFYLWPGLSGNLITLIPLSMPLFGLFALAFANSFLQVNLLGKAANITYRVLLVGCIACVVAGLLAPYRFAIISTIIVGLLWIIGVISIGVIGLRKGIKAARWYLLSWFCFLIGCLLNALKAVGVIESNHLTSNFVFIGAAIEGLLLSFALADRLRLLKDAVNEAQAQAIEHKEKMIAAMRQYNEELEEKVAERTETLSQTLQEVERQKGHAEKAQAAVSDQLFKVNTLLNNAGEGFLSFGEDLQVDESYSAECLRLFQVDKITGSILDLLKPYEPRSVELMEKSFRAVLAKNTPESLVETYLSLLPGNFIINDCFCEVSYRLIVNQHDGQARKLMLVLKDQTEKKRVEDIFKEERNQLELIVHALVNREEFLQVWNGLSDVLNSVIPELLNPNVPMGMSNQERCLEIDRILHTYKGMLYQSHCEAIGDQIHALETTLSDINRDDSAALDHMSQAIKKAPLISVMRHIRYVLERYLTDRYFSNSRLFQLDEQELVGLETLLSKPSPEIAGVLKRLNQLRYERFGKLMAPHVNYLAKEAKSRGVELDPVVIDDDAVMLDPAKHKTLIGSILHLFRNALDHGFDTPEERFEKDKPQAVTFRCEAARVGNGIKIEISDDGRGVDVFKLKQNAISSGLMSDQEVKALSHDEALHLVFMDGLSSSDTVSTTSGRGVGMSALRTEVLKLNGEIFVNSVLGKGSQWTIHLPAI